MGPRSTKWPYHPRQIEWSADGRGGLFSTDGRWLVVQEQSGPRAGRYTLIDKTGKQRWSWRTDYGQGPKAYDVDGMWLSLESAMDDAEEALRDEQGLTSSPMYATLMENKEG